MTVCAHQSAVIVGAARPIGTLPALMLKADDVVTDIDYDEELSAVVVRTQRKTNYEKKLKKKVQTSGCAQGTVFGDLMEALENVSLPEAELRTSWLYALTHKINITPSLYLEAGAIHAVIPSPVILIQHQLRKRRRARTSPTFFAGDAQIECQTVCRIISCSGTFCRSCSGPEGPYGILHTAGRSFSQWPPSPSPDAMLLSPLRR